MLKRESRVNLKKDFENIFKIGKYSSGQFIGFKVAKKNFSDRRYGIIISKKISKKAVIRNRLKRQIRDIIEKEDINLKQGFDSILIPRKDILNKTFAETRNEIKEQLKKNKLY